MENKNVQAIPITDIRKKYGLPELALKEKLIELKLDLMIRRPPNVDIYASGSAITLNSKEPKTIQNYYKRHKGTPFSDDHDFYTKLNENVRFLSITPSMWYEAISFGEVIACKFRSAYLQSKENKLEEMFAQKIVINIPSPPASFAIDSGLFIAPRSGTLVMMDLSITESDIYIKTLDADILEKNVTENATTTNQSIKKEYWISDKLADLNMASDIFISVNPEIDRQELLNNIENWLKAKWKNSNERLYKQAALAVIPDKLYGSAPKKPKPEVADKYPPHTSSALIAMNETAKEIEDDYLKNHAKSRTKGSAIALKLEDEYCFKKILAIEAAAIITLKIRSKS